VDFLGAHQNALQEIVCLSMATKKMAKTSRLRESCDLSNFSTQLSKSTQVLSFSSFQIESSKRKILLLLLFLT
jgi:hypothetical protein